jgi:cell wall-associated NlpC family hydrolase
MTIRTLTMAVVLLGTAATQASTTYTVKQGDSLSRISARLGVSVDALMRANDLSSPHKIRQGQKLVVPGTSLRELSTSRRSSSTKGTYKVQAGDSDWSIARRNGISVEKLHAANPGVAWKTLQIGKTLNLTKGSSSAPAARVASSPVPPTSSSTSYYKVVKGDTRGKIARKLGLSESSLTSLNPSIKWNRLQIGEKLNVRKASTSSAPKPVLALSSSSAAKTVKTSGAILRKGPGTSYSKISGVDPGASLKVLARKRGWIKVVVDGAAQGWIYEKALKQSSLVASTASSAKSSSSSADTLISNASQYKGVRYRWGGTSRSGFDCSGFTGKAFASIGVRLPRTSIEQSKVGVKVSRSELEKGDLVFFKTGRSYRINHVGIYIGGGKFIHSSSGSGHVTVSSLSDSYYNKRFAGARRVRSFAQAETAEKTLVAAAESAVETIQPVAVE